MNGYDWSIVGIGIGTVFVGLICIVGICALLGLILRRVGREDGTDTASAATEVSEPIPNRQELIAAVSAAVAEELGKDVSAIRIHTVKKL